MDKEKERKEFKEHFKLNGIRWLGNNTVDDFFEYFWEQIDIKEQEIAGLEGVISALESKLAHQEAIIKVADEVIENAKLFGQLSSPHNPFWGFLSTYNELKKKKV